MYTTPADPEVARWASLLRWTKRTQEVLAHRSIQGRTFSRLYNLMSTKRLIEVALDKVLLNTGAKTAGVDGITKYELTTTEARKQLVDELWRELSTKTYTPAPVRRVYIPKPNGGQRPLGIPTIRDRVVQEMLRTILEPIYEAKFYRHSYGFRPYRSTFHAAVRIKDLIGRRGYRYAIEGDIRKCFDRIHHVTLVRILRRTIKDERIIRLIKAMLKAGMMEDGTWHVTDEGAPQGGIVSPLLSNVYLNELDQFIAARWDVLTDAEKNRQRRSKTEVPHYIVRYADDFVVMVHGTRADALRIKGEVADFLRDELHLELSEEKTFVTHVERGFDFLGFHIRKYGKPTLITPSRKAQQRFKAEIKARARKGFSNSDAAGIVNLNRYITGWGMYYRRVNSAKVFKDLDHYVWKTVWRITHRIRGGRSTVTMAQHYQKHLISYQFDVNKKNRHRRQKHYGVWADRQQTKAYIVTKLSFLPIRYVGFHPQLNPYVPEEREKLEQKRALKTVLDDIQLSEPKVNPDYGPEWDVVRQTVLEQSGYTCSACGRSIRGRNAHVHHVTALKRVKSRRKAHYLENLVALCRTCHIEVERTQRT